MSCFVVSDNHINALVSLINSYCRGSDPDLLGRKLVDANLRAFHDRYIGQPEVIAKEDERLRTVAAYAWKHPDRDYSAIEGIKLAQSYEYQACEWRNWEHSEARKVITDLIDCLIRLLPGYEAAPWSI